jgi:hypothetical protein
MNANSIACLLALVGLATAPTVRAQALPAGSYPVMRMDFHIGPYHDLQRAHLFHPLWTSSGHPQLSGTMVDSSVAALVGNSFTLNVTGNPFLYTLPLPATDNPSAYITGFVNVAGSLFTLYDYDPPVPGSGLQTAVARVGLGMRQADNLANADLVGDWFHLFWEVAVEDQSFSVMGQSYEVAEVVMRPDLSGLRTIVETSFDEVEEPFAFNWRPDGGELLIEVEDGVRFPVGASHDVILAPVIDRDPWNGRQYLGFDLFVKRATSLTPTDVVGVWGLQFFDMSQGNAPMAYWRSMGSEKALIDLRADLTGTYYSLAVSDWQWIDSVDEMRMDFTWNVDGGSIVVTAPDVDDGEGVHAFTVSASHGFALKFGAETTANEQYQELDILIKLDLAAVPPPVRHTPLYEPLRNGWGQVGFAGQVYTGLWPWVYSPNLGWLRFAEGDGRRLWLHDQQLGWLLTDPLMFPYFFGPEEGAIYYLDMRRGEVTPDDRHFYAYHLGRWMD